MKLCVAASMALLLICCGPWPADAAPRHDGGFRPVQRLLDLSGLAWLGDDTFLAVHDAKNPDELRRVRVSLLMLPQSLEGLLWKPLRLRFPGGASSDLESAARIPGTDHVLLVESGDDAGAFQRIFLAEVEGDRVDVVDDVQWGSFTDVFNVEATAVAGTENGRLFIWAERASGEQSTEIRWAELTLDPFAIGPELASATFELPDDLVDAEGNPLYSRPVVGMDVDDSGRIFTVAAFDPEGTVADPDDGPFRGAVFQIGLVIDGRVEIDAEPTLLATLDGFKPESVASRHVAEGTELFVGTDDENYGGTLRELPAAPVELADDDASPGERACRSDDRRSQESDLDEKLVPRASTRGRPRWC